MDLNRREKMRCCLSQHTDTQSNCTERIIARIDFSLGCPRASQSSVGLVVEGNTYIGFDEKSTHSYSPPNSDDIHWCHLTVEIYFDSISVFKLFPADRLEYNWMIV